MRECGDWCIAFFDRPVFVNSMEEYAGQAGTVVHVENGNKIDLLKVKFDDESLDNSFRNFSDSMLVLSEECVTDLPSVGVLYA